MSLCNKLCSSSQEALTLRFVVMGLTDPLYQQILDVSPGQDSPAVLEEGNTLSCSLEAPCWTLPPGWPVNCSAPGHVELSYPLQPRIHSRKAPDVTQTCSFPFLPCSKAKPETSCPISCGGGRLGSAQICSQVPLWSHHAGQQCRQTLSGK